MVAHAYNLGKLEGTVRSFQSQGSGSGAGSDSSAGSSQVIPMELSQVTDPYLATSGFAGGEVVAKINGDDITVAELLYWLNAATQSYLGQFYGQLSVPPWEADLGDGATLASQMKEQALNTAVFYRSLYRRAWPLTAPWPATSTTSTPAWWSRWARRNWWTTCSGCS